MAIDATSPRSRRALLAGTLGGAVALVAGALGRPLTGQATDGDVIHVGDDVSGSHSTTITTTGDVGLSATSDSRMGQGLAGFATATNGLTRGVHGTSDSPDGVGVQGWATANDGDNWGVSGRSDSTDGIGVGGYAAAASGPTIGVHGISDSTEGVGAGGWASASHGVASGVEGVSGSTEGVGTVGWSSGDATGVLGYSGPDPRPDALSTTGVYGVAAQEDGRGGWFSGRAAQIRLEPSSTTHPASGQMGDLFLDNEGALWLCKGQTDWKLIA